MIDIDIYGKDLSTSFNNKITSPAQKIKPKVVVNWLQSRNISNLSASVDANNQHSSSSSDFLGGDLGYYFTPEQCANGIERQGFTWAVTDAKDVNGNIIRADGGWYTMPTDLDDPYEFGWWSGTISGSTVDPTYGGYGFVDNPTITLAFDSMECNHVRVSTSEYYGQVHTYRLTVRSSDAGVANPLYTEVVTIPGESYYYEHYLPESLGHSTINQVELEILTTRNPLDYGRIQEINTIYKTDVSDDIVSFSWDKTRDLHVTELPIAGSSSGSTSFTFDNTDKNYNMFNSSSSYGKYMKKNVKIESSMGWQIIKSDDLYIDKTLSSNISSSDTTILLSNTDNLPDGGAGDYYVMIIDPDGVNREYILVESTDDTYTITVRQRGYNNSIARNHSAFTTVRFETFEYVAYTDSYVDEWNASSQSMTVAAEAADWTKFASESIITKGFLMEKATVPEAVKALLLKTNFPQKKIKNLNRFERSALENGSVLHMDFSESVSERSGAILPIKNGLRARFFAMLDANFNKVRDILADALDRELTDLEKALGEYSFTSPDYVVNTVDVAYTAGSALDLVDYTFVDINGDSISDYFNGVFDGYYVPIDTGVQYLGISIAHAGVRMYLDDSLILDSWQVHPVSAGQYTDLISDELNLIAGKPYKIRIEFFHQNSTNNVDDFSIYLSYAVGSNPMAVVPEEACYTMAAIDRVGGVDANFLPASTDRNHVKNNGVYIGDVSVGLEGGLVSNPDNFSVFFDGSSYMRLPYDLSWDMNNSSSENYSGKWSIEINVKPSGPYSGNDGEYISSFDHDTTPTGGFEFFNDSSSNGFQIKTSAGHESVSASGSLSTSSWNHIIVTFDGSVLKYYLNGQLQDTLGLVGTISSWADLDVCFGGRNGYYLAGSGEVAPTLLRSFSCDQFLIYNSIFTDTDVANRYTEVVMQPLTIYPFLYGNEASCRDVIEEITLADLGRFYIDELNDARYEHFYRFFEPSIDQHANTQLTISDDSHILSADFNVQLQANKVVVKVANLSTVQTSVQPLWRADDPTTLAVVNLEVAMNESSNSMTVSSTVDPPFFRSGYLVIDNEIIKYSSKTPNTFNNLTRGLFGTTPTAHSQDSPVREVRYWDLKYDNAPAYEIKDPLISGIAFETPNQVDLLQFRPDSYGAKLIISANSSVDKGTFVFAEGTDPVTEKVSFASIAGRPIIVTDQGSQLEEEVEDPSASIADSIRVYGVKEIVIENRYITDFGHAQKIADFIISKMTEPVPVLNIQTLLTPKTQVGDRIKISSMDSFDIINGEYWVVAKSYSFGGTPSQNLMIRKVV